MTTTVEAADPALGSATWVLKAGATAAQWTDSTIPTLDPADPGYTGPYLTTSIDVGGGSEVYGGATFVFDKEVLVGKYVNGDWWVNPDPDGTGSPAVLTDALPASYFDSDPPAHGSVPNRLRNGMMRNVEGTTRHAGL